MNLKDTYNKIAKDWFNDHKESDWWSEIALKFLGYLKKGDKILDVGCGAGLKTKYLIEQGFEAVGIDFSEEMVKLAKNYCPQGTFYVKDIKEPLNLGTFDGIFAQAVLLHIPKAEVVGVLQNFYNSLKSGGCLYLAVKGLKQGEPEEQMVKENDYNYEYERFFSFFTVAEIKNNLDQLGMQILDETVISRGDTDWVIVIAKK